MKKLLILSGEEFPNPYLSLDLIFNHYLPERGIHPIWVMPQRKAKKLTLSSWKGKPLLLIPKLSSLHPLYPFKLRLLIERALEKLKGENLDGVWVRDNPVMAQAGYKIARQRKIPFLYRISHLKEEESLLYSSMGIGPKVPNWIRGRAGKFLRDLFLRKADLAIPISSKMEDYLRRRLKLRKTFLLPEGVDGRVEPRAYDGEATRLRKALAPRGEKIISYIGVLSRFRQGHFLLEVLSLLPQNYILAIAGWERERGYINFLLQRARDLGLGSRAKFLGFLTRERVYSLIRASHAGLSPFPPNPVLLHNSPIKPLEFIMMERPVVSSQVPDTVEIIRKTGGGIICSWDPGCFARALQELEELPMEEAREKLLEERDFGVLAEKLYRRLSLVI